MEPPSPPSRPGLASKALGLFSHSMLEGPASHHSPRPRSEINLQWLIHMRWAAIGGQLITILVVNYLLGVAIPLVALLVVVVIEFGTNAALLVLFRRLVSAAPQLGDGQASERLTTEKMQALQLGITILDTLFLAVLLGLTGGVANPFCAFLVVYVSLAAVLLPIRFAIVAALVVGAVLIGLKTLSPLVLTLDEGANLRGWGEVVAIGLTSMLSVFFVSRVTTALVKRSEQLEAERERRERRRHLEALGTLAAGAAHELATPLSTIAIVAKELQLSLETSGARSDEQVDAQLIREEVARCRRILDRMSTDAGGGLGEPLAPTRPSELAETVVGEMATRERVIVDVEEPPVGEVAPFELPREGLATTIRAIVQNALDASPEEAVVRLVIRREDRRLRIFVTDLGEGMSERDLERATEPFFTTKDVGRGMGLGLYLASSFIENLGGTLEIKSAVGSGTTVRIEIPMGPTGTRPNLPASLES